MSVNDHRAALREYDRDFLREGLVSLFWTVIKARRAREKFTLQQVADAVGTNKSVVSRWFSKAPNWRLDTIADIASALGIDIEFRARERSTGIIFSSGGPVVVQGTVIQDPNRDQRAVTTTTEPNRYGALHKNFSDDPRKRA